MSTYYTGADGSLRIDGQRVAKVSGWSITGTVPAIETTNTGDEARTYIYGIQNYSGSCTCYYYDDDRGGLTMRKMIDNIYRTDATSATATNRLDLRASDGRRIEADVLFTEATTSASAGSVTSVSLSFTVNGHLKNTSIKG